MIHKCIWERCTNAFDNIPIWLRALILFREAFDVLHLIGDLILQSNMWFWLNLLPDNLPNFQSKSLTEQVLKFRVLRESVNMILVVQSNDILIQIPQTVQLYSVKAKKFSPSLKTKLLRFFDKQHLQHRKLFIFINILN